MAVHPQLYVDFRALAPGNHQETSDEDHSYNCIAWAVGDDTRWWWPPLSSFLRRPFDFWPPGVPTSLEVGSFEIAFERRGFRRCDNGDLEPTLEKVAIFTKADGTPTHASRQNADGTWSSKFGNLNDMTHSTIAIIEGATYGTAALFMARDRRTSQAP